VRPIRSKTEASVAIRSVLGNLLPVADLCDGNGTMGICYGRAVTPFSPDLGMPQNAGRYLVRYAT